MGKTPKSRPAILTQPLSTKLRQLAKNNVGSFIDEW